MTATKTAKTAATTAVKAPAKAKTPAVKATKTPAKTAAVKAAADPFEAMVKAALVDRKAKAPATKAVKAPAAPKVKTPKAEKLAEVTEAFVARIAKPGTVVHVIAEGSRPVAGARLAAHTHAALVVLGMLNESQGEATYRDALSVLGSKAVRYHLKEHNMELVANGMIRLTKVGLSKFASRVVDNALANRFVAMFLDGKVDSALGVNSSHVFPLARV